MVPATHDKPPKPPSKSAFDDFVLVLGILTSILTTALIIIFFKGGISASFGVAWAWVVMVGLWIVLLLI